jgi:succinate dehydrogenase / fumarate reductase membrane anchor subunit
LYLLGFAIYFAMHLMLNPPKSHDSWRAWILSPETRAATALFYFALVIHAWVGLRDVILDYVKPFPVRITALLGVAIGLAAMAAWTAALLFGSAP